MYEVEKRSLFSNEEEFYKLKDYLNKHGKYLGKWEFNSFLFLNPEHLRIRLVKGSDKVIITKKVGEFSDPAREEDEREIPLKELLKYVENISDEGYNECTEFNTKRESYEYEGLRIDFNKIDILGLVVEVEALTEDENQISELEAKIRDVMAELGVKELDPNEYKRLISEVYVKNLKKVSEQDFGF